MRMKGGSARVTLALRPDHSAHNRDVDRADEKKRGEHDNREDEEYRLVRGRASAGGVP